MEKQPACLQRQVDQYHNYFLPKKDMIFPCPGFALDVDFLLLLVDELAVEKGVFSLAGAGSSSENDSHAGSSLVTAEVLSAYIYLHTGER